MPSRKELQEKGFTIEQIKALTEEGVEVTDMDETIEEVSAEREKIRKALKEANKDAEKQRLRAKELEELLNQTKETVNQKDESLTELEQLQKQNQLLTNQLNDFKTQLTEADALKTKLEEFEMKEHQRKESLLQQIPEAKRGLFEESSIEIIQEFINQPKDSQGIEKAQNVKGGSFSANTLEDRSKSAYQPKRQMLNVNNIG